MEQKQYQRTSRHLSDETKKKISQSLTGRPKTIAHKQAIRQGELRYWRNDLNFPQDKTKYGQNGITMNDIVL